MLGCSATAICVGPEGRATALNLVQIAARRPCVRACMRVWCVRVCPCVRVRRLGGGLACAGARRGGGYGASLMPGRGQAAIGRRPTRAAPIRAPTLAGFQIRHGSLNRIRSRHTG